MHGGDDGAALPASPGRRRNRATRCTGARLRRLDEQRIYPRLRWAQLVDADGLVAPDHRARQQRYAHVGGDATDHAVERAEFEPRRRRPAEFGEHLFEPLAVSAAGAEHQRGRAGFRRAGAQAGEVLPAARGDQHSSSRKAIVELEFGMLDRAGDEGAVQRAVEHGGHEIGGRRRPQRESHRGKAAMEIGEQRGQAHGGRRLHRADRERSLRLAIVARGQHRFARQRRHPLRIGQQAAAGAGQRHAAAVPLEQARCRSRLPAP